MFSNEDVNAKYVTRLNGEQVIHMPKYNDKPAFRKKLKDLTIYEADALFNRPDKNNILQAKATNASTETKQTSRPQQKTEEKSQ